MNIHNSLAEEGAKCKAYVRAFCYTAPGEEEAYGMAGEDEPGAGLYWGFLNNHNLQLNDTEGTKPNENRVATRRLKQRQK